ncbi:MAG: hypothetical protein AAF304_00030 [Pseudomonadota bacterium]
MKTVSSESYLLPFLSLFTSAGTLICCALPALLVTIGAGAALAGLVSTVPQLIWLSTYKAQVFVVAGLLLLLTGFIQWKMRNAPCPVDPDLAVSCMRMRSINKWVFILSILIYAVGFFFAFLAVKVLG